MSRAYVRRIAVLCCLVAGTAAAEDAGWIDGIEGDEKTVSLIRNGQPKALRPYLQLQVGDQLRVASDKAAVVVATSDGKTQRITFRQSPHVVAPSPGAPTVSGNVLKWVSGVFGDNGKKNAPQSLSAMSSRGGQQSGPLAVPYLAKRFMLVATTDPLYLSWMGGHPPYRVRLIRQTDGTETASAAGIQDRHALMPVADLRSDDYLLEITDASGTTYEDYLRVVPPDRVPSFPDLQSIERLPAHTAALVEASWLGSTENGRWVIESMQRLYRLSASSKTAAAVLQRIEQGATPASD